MSSGAERGEEERGGEEKGGSQASEQAHKHTKGRKDTETKHVPD